MKSQIIKQYDHPSQFEPLMPTEHLQGPLLERAADLARKAAFLSASTSGGSSELRQLLRAMNSYYTNRIEGEHTRPLLIEKALEKDFSTDLDQARRQRLALAHIRTEERCEAELVNRAAKGENVTAWLYSSEALQQLHRELFRDLSLEDLTLEGALVLQPGVFRSRAVAVGIHEAPSEQALPEFINRWSEVYGRSRRGEHSIVAAAASHHRLAWVHPFLDGNGRVTRLHTHLLMHAQGLTGGLWSPLRGYARTEQRYKGLLKAADEHRRGDLDGRGNLTQAGLIAWIEYTLEVCVDQVEFMTKQIDVTSMRQRIAAALQYDATVLGKKVRMESLNGLHYLFATQTELGRADFKAMTGLGDRLATQAVSSLLQAGYLASDTPYGALRFAIPRHALRFYFPSLWPEAEQDQALLESKKRLESSNDLKPKS